MIYVTSNDHVFVCIAPVRWRDPVGIASLFFVSSPKSRRYQMILSLSTRSRWERNTWNFCQVYSNSAVCEFRTIVVRNVTRPVKSNAIISIFKVIENDGKTVRAHIRFRNLSVLFAEKASASFVIVYSFYIFLHKITIKTLHENSMIRRY